MAAARLQVRRLEAVALRKVGIPSEEGVMATAKVEREVEGPATKPNGHAVEGPTNGHALAAPGGELAELEEIERLVEGHWRMMSLCDRVRAIIQHFNCSA